MKAKPEGMSFLFYPPLFIKVDKAKPMTRTSI